MSCENCFFMYTESNDESLVASELDMCFLARKLNFNEYILCAYDYHKPKPTIKRPRWCPLHTYSFKIERLNDD